MKLEKWFFPSNGSKEDIEAVIREVWKHFNGMKKKKNDQIEGNKEISSTVNSLH